MYIEEEVNINSKETSVFVEKINKLNNLENGFATQKSAIQFVYLVHNYSENENDLHDIQAFSEYSIARKYVINRLKRRNSIIDKKLKDFSDKSKPYFTEKYPDQWSNGNEWIKIIIKEIKND